VAKTGLRVPVLPNLGPLPHKGVHTSDLGDGAPAQQHLGLALGLDFGVVLFHPNRHSGEKRAFAETKNTMFSSSNLCEYVALPQCGDNNNNSVHSP